jgi:2-oxoglutarate dehydrogenase E1 component
MVIQKTIGCNEPKSLLRHPKVVSPVEDLANGTFQPILDDPTADPKKVEKLVLCSGKLYFELLAKKEELNDENIALVRLEQLYPLQTDLLKRSSKNIQTEKNLFGHRKNQKTWELGLICCETSEIQYPGISPVPSGAPAPGTHKMFEKNQNAVINRVFDRKMLL